MEQLRKTKETWRFIWYIQKEYSNPLKCSSLFYIGIRKFNVIRAQLRMNCSNLNAHLHNLHVIDSPACVCSHSIEDTAAHFFLYCPLYYTQRLTLQNIVSRYTEFKLETLLFGDTNIDNEDNITIGRITGCRLLLIKSILAVRDTRLLVQSHAKEQYGGTPGGSLLKQLCSMM